MSSEVKAEEVSSEGISEGIRWTPDPPQKQKSRTRDKDGSVSVKRRCVSTACIACRKRKSKCDGNLPSCAACSSVYMTPCVYDPNSDHRRKGVYKKDIDNLKTRNSTLQTLIQAILNYAEENVPELVRQIRTCESLDDVAEQIIAKENGLEEDEEKTDSPIYGDNVLSDVPQFETELSGKMGEMVLDGSVKFIGGTSNLLFLPPGSEFQETMSPLEGAEFFQQPDDAILSWTNVTKDKEVIVHLMNLYFTYHYAYFVPLSKELFYRDFWQGRSTQYCSSLLVNTMLALGCHLTSWPAARANPDDSATVGDHFFKEAKRLILENDEHEKAKLCTVQALALMSVREAGCGREGKGWVYSGMSFRMAYDLGLNLDPGGVPGNRDSSLSEEDIDARRITFWGCFLFDKCWSNYLGRQPQLPMSNITVPKFEVFPTEDAETWSPYTDSEVVSAHTQPARTRAVALQLSTLCEISSDLLISFYHPTLMDKPVGKQTELKKLSDLHTILEAWRKNLPKEMEPKEGQLPQVLLMHMFFQLLFIHLYRPFLKYTRTTSPLPSHVSPRKLCTQAAATISKLLRLYRRSHGLRQICNIAVYIAHSACTIHLLNLPDKNAKRDIVHGVKHLEEIAESWLCARRTLRILSISAERWSIELPEEAIATLSRTHTKYGSWGSSEAGHSPQLSDTSPRSAPQSMPSPQNVTTTSSMPLPTYPPPPAATTEIAYVPPTQHSNGLFPTTNNQPSPAASTPEHRRSSGGFSLPPQSAAELTRRTKTKSRQQRPSGYLTQAQQDAWNQYQATRNASNNGGDAGKGSAGAPSEATSPALLFGGVESLVEESQDWWLKDQSALALGFDNWGETGWSGLGEDVPGGVGGGGAAATSNGFGYSMGDVFSTAGYENGTNGSSGRAGASFREEMYF